MVGCNQGDGFAKYIRQSKEQGHVEKGDFKLIKGVRESMELSRHSEKIVNRKVN